MKNVIKQVALLQCSVISLKSHLIVAKFQGQDLTGHSKEVTEESPARQQYTCTESAYISSYKYVKWLSQNLCSKQTSTLTIICQD
jgi:hypothetical protein